MKVLRSLLLLGIALSATSALAVIETYEFSDPLLEERYQELSAELRCPKCQNQNIADSNAPISQDLRKLLHQKLEEGASDAEILDYMVARYGEFVRYRPSFGGVNMLLWLAPLLLLIVGLAVMAATLRSRGRSARDGAQALSEEERNRLQSMFDESERDV